MGRAAGSLGEPRSRPDDTRLGKVRARGPRVRRRSDGNPPAREALERAPTGGPAGSDSRAGVILSPTKPLSQPRGGRKTPPGFALPGKGTGSRSGAISAG